MRAGLGPGIGAAVLLALARCTTPPVACTEIGGVSQASVRLTSDGLVS